MRGASAMALIFMGLHLYGLFRYTQLMVVQDDLTTVRYLQEELHEQSDGWVQRIEKITLKHRYGANKHVLKLMKTRNGTSLPSPNLCRSCATTSS